MKNQRDLGEEILNRNLNQRIDLIDHRDALVEFAFKNEPINVIDFIAAVNEMEKRFERTFFSDGECNE